MNRRDYCNCCGAIRGLSGQQSAYSMHDIVQIADHRKMLRGDERLYEEAPQLIVHVGVYRNGGGASNEEHICSDCLQIGIQHVLTKLEALRAVSASARTPWDPQHTLSHGRTVPPPPFPPAPPRPTNQKGGA